MIFPVESQSKVRTAPALPLTTKLGPVHIAVTDRTRALETWRDVVGLDLMSEEGNELRLGVGGKVLIVLETGAIRPVGPLSRRHPCAQAQRSRAVRRPRAAAQRPHFSNRPPCVGSDLPLGCRR